VISQRAVLFKQSGGASASGAADEGSAAIGSAGARRVHVLARKCAARAIFGAKPALRTCTHCNPHHLSWTHEQSAKLEPPLRRGVWNPGVAVSDTTIIWLDRSFDCHS
jgi:hypothetical protein